MLCFQYVHNVLSEQKSSSEYKRILNGAKYFCLTKETTKERKYQSSYMVAIQLLLNALY